ncbi:dihydrofolate reductase family protein [Amycolatopsis orientalis]|uniref:dihydrofolate reductase family protein n=1 Tax=Amycolatopsis orientalis TaxID=31958 RepID=UPI00039A0DAB|nr:dihydrofolate reductase family protein [Amycolatopsis orientalis]
MADLVYLVHTSLDGCVEGPAGEFDWPLMGPELSDYANELSERAAMFAYGRRVWEMMSSYWPDAESISDHPHDLAFAPLWRKKPKLVFSRTLPSADWNTQIANGDLTEEVARHKAAADGDIVLMGGYALAAELGRRGLIDEYLVCVHPVLLGGDKRPFAEAADRTTLDLRETRTFDNAVVLLRYHTKH